LSKSRKKSGGRRTRFNLTRKGEIALAAVGVLVVALVVFIVWGLLSPKILPVDEARAQKDREIGREYEARFGALLKDGTILKADEGRQDVYVDPEKWNALLPTEQGFAAAAACGHFKWHRCFVYDAAGQQLGWYTASDGYRSSLPQGKP
jgi:hypothetical protein